MTSKAEQTDRAYRLQRARHNATQRYTFSWIVVAVCAAFLAVYATAGVLDFSLDSDARGIRSSVFVWLVFGGLFGISLGHRAYPANNGLVDILWASMLLAGAVLLAVFDAPPRDISGFALIVIPLSVLFSAGRTTYALLFGLSGVLTLGLTQLTAAPDIGNTLHSISLVVVSIAAIYMALNLEQRRITDYMAMQAVQLHSDEVNRINLELEARTAQLAFANNELEQRSEELQTLNEALNDRQSELEELNQKLESLAMVDELTELSNRRRIQQVLSAEVARCQRYNSVSSVAVIDLDDFGLINKRYGILSGDALLSQFAGLLKRQARAADVVARYGGEEFVIMMPNSDADGAYKLIERIREMTAKTPLTSRKLAVSFSAGVTQISPKDNGIDAILERADQAMRQAKSEGKNRVKCA